MTRDAFENWSTARDTVTLPQRRIVRVDGVDIVEHTEADERAVFAQLWNMAATRLGLDGRLVRP